jgi:hypothetical protein
VTTSPRCLLPELEAHKLCALIGDCPELSAAIVLSTGVSVGQVAPDGSRLSFNYSGCVDWLASPLELAHRGFDSARSTFNCLAAISTCQQASACVAYELLLDDDARCAGESGRRCEADALIDCDAREVTHCDAVSFPVTTSCEEGEDGVATCRLGACDEPGLPACEENLAEYAIACTAELNEVGVSCTAAGLSCADDLGCTSISSGVPPGCETPFEQGCSGSLAQTCAARTSGGLLHAEIDCTKLGLECDSQAGIARCKSPTATCRPTDGDVNVCDGTRIALCVGGIKSSFDCATLGLTCDGGSSARCATGGQ